MPYGLREWSFYRTSDRSADVPMFNGPFCGRGELGGQPTYKNNTMSVPGQAKFQTAAETLGLDLRGIGESMSHLVVSHSSRC